MSGDPVSSGTARSKPWVLVRAGASRLAIHSDWVRELLALPAVTRLPGLPPDALGLITWRGRAVPAIDLGARLGVRWVGGAGETAEPTGRRMAVVVADGTRHVALAVDAVDGVELLAADSIAPLPEGLGAAGPAVREHGRTRRDGTLVLLLDVAGLLGVDRTPTEDVRAGDFWGQAPAIDAAARPEVTANGLADPGDAGRARDAAGAALDVPPPADAEAPPAADAARKTPKRSRSRASAGDAATPAANPVARPRRARPRG